MKGACSAGLGYALLPRRAVQLERRSGLLHEVEGFGDSLTGHVWICRCADGQVSAAVQRFLDFLQEFSASGSLQSREPDAAAPLPG